jgi:hypothetical protein
MLTVTRILIFIEEYLVDCAVRVNKAFLCGEDLKSSGLCALTAIRTGGNEPAPHLDYFKRKKKRISLQII